MFARKIIAAGVVTAALWAAPSAAAVVDLRFQDVAGAQVNTQDFGPNVYLDWQIAFRAGSWTGDYDFHFTYDTDAAGPSHGLTLVSGRVGTFTDFAGWTPSLTFTANAGLLVRLERIDQLTCCLSYRSGVYFLMQDDDGDLGPGLPTALDIADLDTASASFENRRNGGVGLGYSNIGYSRFGGTIEVPAGTGDPGDGGTQPVGGVPEPAAWALMILGFGAAGASLRRRRAIVAATNASA